ncbi:MAG: PqqD family protein [Oscillospiraceae bacterium]|nr:PqqD family protein [Oscillospiraceae bacterium]
MKLKYEFAVREIAGEYVLIPMGSAALAFSGMVSTNAVGAYICKALAQPTDEASLLEGICAAFDIDRDTAKQDMGEFLTQLARAGLLEK